MGRAILCNRIRAQASRTIQTDGATSLEIALVEQSMLERSPKRHGAVKAGLAPIIEV